ncbi:hypothetical protein OPIT5_23900 [Opitutaceae bacterium TAV5]|nr:hypothetical protein OPIT5_23900 [Opitutaceae bacterium TAV5]
MTISADLTINGLTGGSTNGIGLGFFSSSPAQAGGQSIVGFTGLVLSPDGTLNLMSNGVGVTAYTAPIPGFATTTTYNLSYSIDTTTGGITSVSLNGSDLGSIFSSVTGIFTDSATVYAGFFGRSNAYGSTGIIDNFKLTTVIPEASAIWLIAPAFAFALMLKRRRK